MLLSDPDDPVFRDLDEMLSKMSLSLVDLSMRTKNGTTQVHVVLHTPTGLSIDECAKVHRILLPRLEGLLQTEDLHVEVSSPGLERNMKFIRELKIFLRKKVKLYLIGGKDWEEGLLETVSENEIVFQTKDGPKTVETTKINKARLYDI